MKAGRKNLIKESKEDVISLREGHSIMQVVSLRGSNLIEQTEPRTINLQIQKRKEPHPEREQTNSLDSVQFVAVMNNTLYIPGYNLSSYRWQIHIRRKWGHVPPYDVEKFREVPVMDAKGIKSLALFPAKFQRSFWIKRGSFVVVDESGRDEALESGSKIACMVSQVLFHDQIRTLQKSSDWPVIFRAETSENLKAQEQLPISEREEDLSSDGEDDLPPLEANLNRNRPIELYSDSGSESDLES